MQDREQHNIKRIKCRKCHNVWHPEKDKIYWDEKGHGYSTKLCNCPECNTVNIIEYYEDRGLDINKDTYWYNY